MTGLPIYRTAISGEWIDYNGHLRDAYYSLIVSLAADAMMDRIGLDEGYRKRTRCTLYTLEMHMHFLREVKQSQTVDVWLRILGTDAKRIHAAYDLYCAGNGQPAATAELMLLHVCQGDSPAAQPFPPDIQVALTALTAASAAGSPTAGPESAAPAMAATPTAATPTAATPTGATPTAATPIPGSRRMELRKRS